MADFKKLLPVFEKLGLKLAGGDGEGEPIINSEEVQFNGSRHCGHPENPEVVIPWPTPDAWGIGNQEAIKGTWFAGVMLNARVCNGDCSYEGFYFPRALREKTFPREYNGEIYYSDFCKTAYRPYDLAVITFLIIAKHHLRNNIIVHSDGTLENWRDGMALVHETLGYGDTFTLDEDVVLKDYVPPEERKPENLERLSVAERNRLIKKALRKAFLNVSVRGDRGTAYGWVNIRITEKKPHNEDCDWHCPTCSDKREQIRRRVWEILKETGLIHHLYKYTDDMGDTREECIVEVFLV